ncbi:peptidase S9 prolyl oligopeptidase active site domain-containing protein [Emticicia oligotrophica DSM 17448]|uniref:Peptidase S9 prolyl oligopeptidase active site domain-containing protein n=1 Tax=Emticicia oligotrophica (strain DSM 17448 / CIP 109782 / MTCC 6937 / GPTSA100-15) TaxID=929562 RepID=A0ABM5N176_EMTOG|nr:S9 family peptidase [Emticicia oligotrophica]AFK03121.1 peptidase S9 prolyl oligopeptidase active site domain-containing protein [Emticicia oligotrophica DSM 17448]
MRIILTLIFISNFVFAQVGKEKVLVTDLTKIKQIGAINVSPDGKKAIYSVRTTEQSEENKLEYDYRSHLYLTDFQTTKQITRGTESVGSAVWSPDSKQIAFARNVKGKSQIFIMPLDGGEAFQLTDVKYGASNPNWSKDGSKISFSVGLSLSELVKDTLLNPTKSLPAWSLEKPGFTKNEFLKPAKGVKPNPDGTIEEIRAYLEKDVEDKKAKVINRLNFQGEATTQPELNFSHIYVIDAREGAKPMPVTAGFNSFGGGAWLPDGRLAFVTALDSLQHPDREQDNKVSLMNANGSNRKVILSEKGKSFGGVSFSPDGQSMVYTKSNSQGVNIGELFLAKADGSNSQLIKFDRSVSGLTWSKDLKYVYFTAQSNGGQPIYRIDVNSKKVEQLTDFDSGILGFDLSADKIIYSKTEVANPNELYVADLQMKNPVKITSINDWVKNKALSFPEKRTYTNSKGQKIEYWIMKPSNFEAGKKYPLLLNMHGGPTAMWGPGEFSMWHEHQYFCSQGYGVVYANPRGSGGYGLEFMRANIKDWGTGPTEDVLAAATDAAKAAWVDTARQVITGGSYAGYLTAWIVAHDHRFKAAFAQRGVYDLTTFLGEGNAWRLIPSYFNYPWNDTQEKVLESNSPYTFVDKIRTPLLIKHGENDLRTGVIQSEMMYKSMKIMGKQVEYVRMPGGTHELSRSGNVRQRIDRMLRIYEFFERFVGTK